jgi:hypothetical protein
MERHPEQSAWTSGYESALDDAIRMVDSLRGSGAANLATPIILRLRAELIAMRDVPAARAA